MKFALIGNPNSGKTTLFNRLTDANAHVGNWPGVTVEKKEGSYKKTKNEDIKIIDLPGIYSLSPYTPEEIVSRNYLLNDNPDVVINIVDATNLERNLYLTTQLLEMDLRVVVALNMIDVTNKDSTQIDVERLSKILGVKIVPISALKGDGINDLMKVALEETRVPRQGVSLVIDKALNQIIEEIIKRLDGKHKIFHAVKVLETDDLEAGNIAKLGNELELLKKTYPENIFENDFSGIVADARYQFLGGQLGKIVSKKEKAQNLSKSDRIDKVLTHKWWGLPIFVLIMFFVFHLTFSENLFFLGSIFDLSIDSDIFGSGGINSPGVILFNLMEMLTGFLSDTFAGWLESSPEWVNAFLVDGLWAALSAVLSFIPQILCLYFFITLLEDSGYMARIAFIMDRLFRKFGLSGKSFLPLLMCFGCAVPGIMATRTLENKKERRLTIMLTPFFSCGAKLPIWAVFAAIMYNGAYAEFVVFAIYLLGIVVSVIAALIMTNTVFKGEVSPFVMELPAYHFPHARNIFRNLWDKLKGYIIRAGTIIAGAIVILWFLSNFGFADGTFGMVDIGDSILAVISKWLAYVFYPLGFGQNFGGTSTGYIFVVAAFTGLIAKEMVPATLALLVNMDPDAVLDGVGLIGSPLHDLLSKVPEPALWAFLAFNLLVIPCMAAVAATRKELGNKKEFWITMGFWFAIAYLVAMMIFYGMTYLWLGIVFIVLVIALIAFVLIRSHLELKQHQYQSIES